MGIFKKLEGLDVKPTRGYFGEGNATIKLEKMFIKEKRDGGEAFIAEFKVLDSESGSMVQGSNQSFYRELAGKFPELALKQIYRLVEACCEAVDGEDAPAITEELMEKVCGEDNPLAGAKLNVVGTKKTSQKGKDYLDLQFYPIN